MVLPVLLGAVGVAGAAGAAASTLPCRWRSDFTYSIRVITPSSFTSPWNVGISGW